MQPNNLTEQNNNFEVVVNNKRKFFLNQLDNNYSIDRRYYDYLMDEPEEIQDHVLTSPNIQIALSGMLESILHDVDGWLSIYEDGDDPELDIHLVFHGGEGGGNSRTLSIDRSDHIECDCECFRGEIRNELVRFFYDNMHRLA